MDGEIGSIAWPGDNGNTTKFDAALMTRLVMLRFALESGAKIEAVLPVGVGGESIVVLRRDIGGLVPLPDDYCLRTVEPQ